MAWRVLTGIPTIMSLSLLAGAGAARGDTAEQLLAQCSKLEHVNDINSNDYTAGLDSAACIGYVKGVVDLLAFYREMNPKFCPRLPVNISYDQSIKIVIKYLNDHPAGLNNFAVVETFKAFVDAYPCAQ